MRKSTKIWLGIAGLLVLIGCILFAVAMSVLEWDFRKLSAVHYETNVYEVPETFHNISITSDTAGIQFASSDDGTCRIECHEKENAVPSIAVKNDTLVIQARDTSFWYFFGFNSDSPKITVYLPEAEYRLQSVKIKTATGKISLENLSADSLDLSVSTGKVVLSDINCSGTIQADVSTGKADLTNIACGTLRSDGSTGTVSLSSVIASEEIFISRNTGNVKFSDCDAARIKVNTSTGNVTGSLLSDKIFVTNSNTGKVSVPNTTDGGRCEINTNTGNIEIDISK